MYQNERVNTLCIMYVCNNVCVRVCVVRVENFTLVFVGIGFISLFYVFLQILFVFNAYQHNVQMYTSL